MRLKQIQDFVAVVQAGSIHAAARRIGVSPPAVTKSVRSLENELHAQLLRRTNHGIVPTSAGKAFFRRALVAHTELRKAQDDVRQLTGEGGAVAFGSGPTAAMLVVPDAIVQFRKQHPAIPVRILEGNASVVLPLVREEILDFALAPRHSGLRDPALTFRPIFRHHAAAVARKGHPLANARSLGQLAAAEWLYLLPPDDARSILEEASSSAGFAPPKATVQCESYQVFAGLLARTDMIGICSHRIATSRHAHGELQRIPVGLIATYTVGIVTRKDSPLTQVAAALARAVTACARRLPAV